MSPLLHERSPNPESRPMNRRGFLQVILAAGVAPAVVGSGVLMPIRALVRPTLGETITYGGLQGLIDDTPALPTLTEIMVATFREHGPRIAVTVQANNA